MERFFQMIKQRGDCDPRLFEIFQNCYSDTLKNTIRKMEDGTYHVITGDIPAMWLRDSAAQLRPYIIPAKVDETVREMIAGVIRRQFMYICIDGYANAFNEAPDRKSTRLNSSHIH